MLDVMMLRLCGNLAFYLWGISLIIAIGLTLRSVVNSHFDPHVMWMLALSALVAIFSAAIGFLIGAYFPVSMLPKGIEYLTSFFPGTYSASLFRNYLMSGPMEMLEKELLNMGIQADSILGTLRETFSFDINFFQWNVPQQLQAWILACFTAIFGGICLLFSYHNFMRLPKLRKKKKAEDK